MGRYNRGDIVLVPFPLERIIGHTPASLLTKVDHAVRLALGLTQPDKTPPDETSQPA